MAVFRYKALDASGAIQAGTMEAEAPKQLRELLRAASLTPIEVHDASAKQPWIDLGLSRSQRVEVALLPAQTIKIRQLAGSHHSFCQPGVHTIKTDHNYLFPSQVRQFLIYCKRRLKAYAGCERGGSTCGLLNKISSADFLHD